MKFLLLLLICGVVYGVEYEEVETTTEYINEEVPEHVNSRQNSIDDSSLVPISNITDFACTEDNMEWLSCGPRCYQTCGFQPRDARHRESRAVCASSNDSGCYVGCFCKSGYVRLNDRCVLPVDCPTRPCGIVNEEYKQCGTPCQINCDSYPHAVEIEERCPTDICIRGCFCKSGYVRSASGICVLPVRCPRPLVV